MTPRVLQEWANRTAAEYRSAAVTAQVVQGLIQVGSPRDLIDDARRIVGDELDHAELSHTCLVALGGAPGVSLDAADMAAQTHPGGALASVLRVLTRSFCIGETLAVPLFRAMFAHTTHPAVLPVMERVLQDEAFHRAFGWRALDHLIQRDPDGVRAFVSHELGQWLPGYEQAYAGQTGAALTEAERGAGLIDVAEYDRVFWETVRGDLGERAAKRGLVLPARYR